METIFDFASNVSHESVWWGINGIWLGILLTGLTALALRYAKHTNAATRYGIWWLVMILVIAMPFLLSGFSPETATGPPARGGSIDKPHTPPAHLMTCSPPPAGGEKAAGSQYVNSTQERSSGETLRGSTRPGEQAGKIRQTEPPSPAPASVFLGMIPLGLGVAWLGIAGALLWRLRGAYRRLVLMKRRSLPIDDSLIAGLASELKQSIVRRGVQVRLTTEADFPVAAGLGNPFILIPEKLVDQMSVNELEAILLHELAHLRRRDDWRNLIQRIIEALFFFHPAVRWVSQQLDLERELACDDIVITRTGRPGDYHRCLTRLIQLATGTGTTLLTPGALTGRKQIFKRFERLLTRSKNAQTRFSPLRFAAVALGLAFILAISVRVAPVVALPVEAASFADLRLVVGIFMTDDRGKADGDKIVDKSEESAPVLPLEVSVLMTESNADSKNVDQPPATREVTSTRPVSIPPTAVLVPVAKLVPPDLIPPTETPVKLAPPLTALEVASTVPALMSLVIPPAPLFSKSPAGSGGRRTAKELIDSDDFTGLIFHDDDGVTSVTWSDGRNKVSVISEGRITFTDDDRAIESMSEDAYLYILEKRGSKKREIEIEPGRDGAPEYTYYDRDRECDLDDDAREWLADILIEAIRKTGFGAEDRVLRILDRHGVKGVLDEIEKIESSYVQRLYFRELLAGADLTKDEYSRVLKIAAYILDSDYEKAELLIELADHTRNEPDLMADYVDAVATIDSDYETRRVLSALSLGDNISREVVLAVLDIAADMDSDYEKAELLIEMAPYSRDDRGLQDAYVMAVEDIDSDYETRRVLSALSIDESVDSDVVRTILVIADRIDSDYEKAELLIELAPLSHAEHGFQEDYVLAVEDIDSDYETRRVLTALGSNGKLATENVSSILRIAEQMDSDYEKAELLIEIARDYEGDAEFGREYVQVVESIDSDYETRRALTALTLNNLSDHAVLLAVLDVASNMDSDFEKAELLIELADFGRDDTDLQMMVIEAASSLDSDFESRRVLSSVTFDCDTSIELIKKLIRNADGISSDYESAQLLLDMAPCAGKVDAVREAYLDAAVALGSDYEFKRVLMGLIGNSDINDEFLMTILPLITRMSSDYEKSEILKTLARYCRSNEEVEDAFVEAIESLDSEYEKKELYMKLYRKAGRSRDGS